MMSGKMCTESILPMTLFIKLDTTGLLKYSPTQYHADRSGIAGNLSEVRICTREATLRNRIRRESLTQLLD